MVVVVVVVRRRQVGAVAAGGDGVAAAAAAAAVVRVSVVQPSVRDAAAESRAPRGMMSAMNASRRKNFELQGRDI